MGPWFVLLLICLAGPIHAGAWPRESGKAFIAASANFSQDGTGAADGYQSLYAEYGVTPRLTFGAKLWRRADGRHGDAMAFALYPLVDPGGAHKFAIGLGAGARHFSDGRTLPILVPQFHWGKGFEGGIAPGWMSLSVEVGRAFGADDRWAKADFTFGLKPDDKTHLILQLRAYDEPTGKVGYFAPSYVRQIRKGVHLEAGMTWRMKGDNRLGVSLGSWIDF